MIRTFRRIRRLAGKSISLTAAICVLVGTAYVPIPGVVQKDLSVPFPCLGKPCDCRSATDCWASCCCHSDAQKLAWAQKNSVSPPEWFIDGLRRTNHKLVAAVDDSCCQNPATDGCAAEAKQATVTNCCATDGPKGKASASKADGDPKTQPMSVCVKQQRKCKGQDGILHLELLFVEIADTSVDTVHLQPRYRLFDLPAHSLEISPPTPPPRRV